MVYVGEILSEGDFVNLKQVCNFLAKGAACTIDKSERMNTMLPLDKIEILTATQINTKTAEESIGIKLPEIKVNTMKDSNIPVSYFMTNNATVFVWPPYYNTTDGMFYVNGISPIKVDGKYVKSDNAKFTETSDLDNYTSPSKIFLTEGEVEINFGSEKFILSASNPPATEAEVKKVIDNATANTPTVYFIDGKKPSSPAGIEAKALYKTK